MTVGQTSVLIKFRTHRIIGRNVKELASRNVLLFFPQIVGMIC